MGHLVSRPVRPGYPSGRVMPRGIPHEVSNVEYHAMLVDVELGRESLYLALDGVPCIFVHLLDVA